MPSQPNIMMIHCHDLGAYLHCYGVPTVQTPNLDAFAGKGVRFTRSYCSAPQCSPSRASLFTGRWPHNNGVMGLTHNYFAWDLHEDEIHLAQCLRDAGYATGSVGIIHETKSGHERCGYERRDPEGHVSKAADATIAMMKDLKEDGRPFFLCTGFIEPHRVAHPEVDPGDFYGFITDEYGPDVEKGVAVPGYLRDTEGTRAELAELQGAIKHLDTHVGRILAAVEELGLAGDTLVLFTTDHGYAMPRAKCTLYDPGLEVALMLRLPTRTGWHGGRVVPEMVSNVDVLPTLLELAGVEIPSNVQGSSFAPLLDGRDYAPNNAVFGELTYHDYYDPQRCIRTETHKLIVHFSASPAFMDCSQSWRPRAQTVEPPRPGLAYTVPVELYDLEADPWELKNLADEEEHAAVRTNLLARLCQHMEATDDPLLQGGVAGPMHYMALDQLRGA